MQDPADAIADEMPLSALAAVEADLSIPSVRIGDVLSDLAREAAGPGVPVPPELRIEVDIAAGEASIPAVPQSSANRLLSPAPDCGGVLTTIGGSKPLRFRCQVGHAFTADVLAKHQENAVDEALRVALRIIEGRAELVERMAKDGRNSGRLAVAEMYEARAEEYRNYAGTIRRAVLMSLPTFGSSGDEGGQNE